MIRSEQRFSESSIEILNHSIRDRVDRQDDLSKSASSLYPRRSHHLAPHTGLFSHEFVSKKRILTLAGTCS